MYGPDRLARILSAGGALPDGSPWRGAVAGVDRGRFVPGTIEGADRGEDEEGWRRHVYGDFVIVPQHDDGARDGPRLPTPSTSKPSLMLEMLDLTDVHDGHRVLEIGTGTGTGYNAAWLSHRLGDSHVTSIETDPALYAQARANLKNAGHFPTLVLSDGLAGHPAAADRDEFATEQYGPRRLWDEAEAAWLEWMRAGRPERARIGVTASGDGMAFWLDDPRNQVAVR